MPGFDFHPLKGHKPTRYSLHVNGPWCITFEWDQGDALHVKLEQYHQGNAMTTYTAKRDRAPVHPGAILREDVLPALGLSVAETARRLHVSRQTLHDLLAERKSFTPEMALRVGKLAGNGAPLWLSMQQDFDLWHTESGHAHDGKTAQTALPQEGRHLLGLPGQPDAKGRVPKAFG